MSNGNKNISHLSNYLYNEVSHNNLKKNKKYTPTYIHNWSLQPFSQDYGPASHRT